MADEVEIDVMGDFDFKLEAGSEIYDANELPSKSANLLPEYTNPPWMLEQGWNLDMDEKSKATIEKMLLEEQQYLNRKTSKSGRALSQKLLSSPEKSKSNLISSHYKRVWSEQEKQMLVKGMVLSCAGSYGKERRSARVMLIQQGRQEIYGRSWTKIAELIPTRSIIQIKSFATQFLRAKEKEKTIILDRPAEVADNSSNLLQETIAAVSTAQPTIPVRNIIIPSKGRIPKAATKEVTKSKVIKSPSKNSKKKVSKTTDPMNTIAEVPKSLTNGVTKVGSKSSVMGVSALSVITDTRNHKVTITPNLIGNLNGFCPVTDIIPANETEAGEEVDIDIENDDDDVDTNPVLQSRSTSPNSVYEKLISEANIEKFEGQKPCVEEADNGHGSRNFISLESKSSEIVTSFKECNSLNESFQEDKNSNTDICGVSPGAKSSENCLTSIKEPNNGDYTSSNECDTNKDKTEEQRPTSELDSRLMEKVPQKRIYVNSVTTVEGEVIHFPVPTHARVLHPGEISDEERTVHPEFFGSRSSKTPERYLKIRNYIIESWKKCQPNYLNKTSVRPGLKNCGDVNCIGRIHAYLECIGAINFGCEQACYNVPKYPSEAGRKDKGVRELPGELNLAKLEAMRPRKRKVRDEFGFWIDEKELQGKTIQHTELSKESGSKPQKSKQIKSGYDPFKLVPCQLFSEDNPAPFHVEVHKSALIVMDIHAHISKTEVIGMLGGKYCRDQGKLTVSMAAPCNSISTGMQCEMDPVSQTQASEEIRSAGLKVIGWYHSHPVFDPNPSVRDMETQMKFQEWFAKGGSNFVGMIVSPYNPSNPSMGSEFNCLTIQEQQDGDSVCNTLVPYKFEFTSCDSDVSEISNLILTAQDLSTSYCNYRNRVDLSSYYRKSARITCLDKLIESVRLQFAYPSLGLQELMNSIRKAFTTADDVHVFSDTMVTDMETMATDMETMATDMDTMAPEMAAVTSGEIREFINL